MFDFPRIYHKSRSLFLYPRSNCLPLTEMHNCTVCGIVLYSTLEVYKCIAFNNILLLKIFGRQEPLKKCSGFYLKKLYLHYN